MASPYDNLRFSQSQVIPQYAGAPVEEFSKLLAKREAEYKSNLADIDQLELAASTLDVNDADYEVKKAALDKVRETIQGIANSGGAYEFAGDKIRAAARNFMGNEALQAAMKNQATIKTKKDEYTNLYLNKKISEVGYAEAMRRLADYQGIGEGENGIYATPDLYTPVKYTDYTKKLDDFGKGFKADLIDSGWVQSEDGRWLNRVTKRELSADEVVKAMREYAESDPDIMATINEHQTITGEDILTKNIVAQGIKLGFKEEQFDTKAQPYTLSAYRERVGKDKTDDASIPYDIITRVPGSKIKSIEDYHKEVQTIEKSYDTLLEKRNKLSIDPYTNRTELYKINQDLEALAGQKEAYENTYKKYEQRALKELGKTSAQYAENIIPFEEFKQQKRIDASPNLQDFYFTKEGIKDLENQYKKYLEVEAPIASKINEYFIKAGEDKTMLGTARVLSTEKERKTLGAIFDSTFGLGALYKGKTLEDKAADTLLMGATFVGTEKGGQQVDNDTLEKVNSRGEVNYYTDPATGRQGLITDLLDKDGRSLGKVFISTPSLQEYILQKNPDALGAIVGGQITEITSSLDGTGKVNLSATKEYPPLSVDVEYLGNDLEASEQGLYKLTYTMPSGKEKTGYFVNNLALMKAIKNLYLLQKNQ